MDSEESVLSAMMKGKNGLWGCGPFKCAAKLLIYACTFGQGRNELCRADGLSVSPGVVNVLRPIRVR